MERNIETPRPHSNKKRRVRSVRPSVRPSLFYFLGLCCWCCWIFLRRQDESWINHGDARKTRHDERTTRSRHRPLEFDRSRINKRWSCLPSLSPQEILSCLRHEEFYYIFWVPPVKDLLADDGPAPSLTFDYVISFFLFFFFFFSILLLGPAKVDG